GGSENQGGDVRPAARRRPQTISVFANAVRRDRCAFLSRRALDRLRLRRVRASRTVRPDLSRFRWQVADLNEGRRLSAMAARWERAVLPFRRSEDDGGGSEN